MKKLLSNTGLLVIFAAAVLAIAAAQLSLRGLRVDLTEDRLYTLADGTREILDELPNPVALEFFFTEEATRDMPGLRTYAQRVQDLLNEYALRAPDKLSLTITDPEPFSEAEDRAVADGITRAPLMPGAPEVFFGLVARGPGDNVQTLPFFNPAEEGQLEQQLSKAIYLAGRDTAPVVGLMSSLPVGGGFDPRAGQPTPPWMAVQQLKQLFTVENIGTDPVSVPESVTTLVVVHPTSLTVRARYAIDQFLMRGGNLILLIDPQADVAQANPMAGGAPQFSSNPSELMAPWGLSMTEAQVLADAGNALNVGGGAGRGPVRHIGIYRYGQANFPGDSPLLEQLESINFATAGMLQAEPAEGLSWTPLVVSGTRAGPIEQSQFEFLFDPSSLQESFKATGEQYTVAGLLSGKLPSAFPDGAPAEATAESEAAEGESDDATGDEENAALPPHLGAAEAESTVLVVADVDFLADRLWVQVQQFFGRSIGQPFADNGAFFANAVDALQGDTALMGLRARGQHLRPFTVVEDLQRDAEQRFLNKERELMARLEETENKLAELQQAKAGEGEDLATLSDEQLQAIADFEDQQLSIRKELRQVQHGLREDIDKLENQLKLGNILVLPLLLSGGLYLIARMRRRRYRAPEAA